MTWSAPRRLNPQPEPIYTDGENRPKVLASPDGALYVTWSRPLSAPYTGFVRFSRSLDGGRTWSTPASLARTDGGSDHPQLLARDRHVYLSWRTQAEGYRLIDVTDAVPPNAALEAAP